MPLHINWISVSFIIYTLRTTSTQYCPDGEFTCTDGQCIEYDRSCDSREDCTDGIDEYQCEAYRGTAIGLVIDSNMSPTDYENVLTYFKSNFLQSLDIGPEYSQFRVAAVTYGEVVYVNDSFSLDTYRSKDEVSKAILRMPHKNGLRKDTGSAIKFMRDTLMAGARDFSVRKIIIVLTDGNSQGNVSTAEQANSTRQQGFDLFAVGVGRNVNDKELLKIAGRFDRIFKSNSTDNLKYILDDLARKVCEDPDPLPSSTTSRNTDSASTKESETSDPLSKSTTSPNTNSASTNESAPYPLQSSTNSRNTTSASTKESGGEGKSSSIATIISITVMAAVIALLALIAAYKKWQQRKKARCDLGAPYDSGGEIPREVTEPNVYS